MEYAVDSSMVFEHVWATICRPTAVWKAVLVFNPEFKMLNSIQVILNSIQDISNSNIYGQPIQTNIPFGNYTCTWYLREGSIGTGGLAQRNYAGAATVGRRREAP